ncbi:hypothetical protein HK096_006041, partial [Nowakowskiella sp. JEL0078]
SSKNKAAKNGHIVKMTLIELLQTLIVMSSENEDIDIFPPPFDTVGYLNIIDLVESVCGLTWLVLSQYLHFSVRSVLAAVDLMTSLTKQLLAESNDKPYHCRILRLAYLNENFCASVLLGITNYDENCTQVSKPACVEYNCERYDDAFSSLNKVLEETTISAGRPQTAILYFRDALEVNSDDFFALANISLCFKTVGNIQAEREVLLHFCEVTRLKLEKHTENNNPYIPFSQLILRLSEIHLDSNTNSALETYEWHLTFKKVLMKVLSKGIDWIQFVDPIYPFQFRGRIKANNDSENVESDIFSLQCNLVQAAINAQLFDIAIENSSALLALVENKNYSVNLNERIRLMLCHAEAVGLAFEDQPLNDLNSLAMNYGFSFEYSDSKKRKIERVDHIEKRKKFEIKTNEEVGSRTKIHKLKSKLHELLGDVDNALDESQNAWKIESSDRENTMHMCLLLFQVGHVKTGTLNWLDFLGIKDSKSLVAQIFHKATAQTSRQLQEKLYLQSKAAGSLNNMKYALIQLGDFVEMVANGKNSLITVFEKIGAKFSTNINVTTTHENDEQNEKTRKLEVLIVKWLKKMVFDE